MKLTKDHNKFNVETLMESQEIKKQNLNQGKYFGRWYFGKKIDQFGEHKMDSVIFDDGEVAIDFTTGPEVTAHRKNQIKRVFEMDYNKGLLELDTSWSKKGYKPYLMYKLSGVSGVSGTVGGSGWVLPETLTHEGVKGLNNKPIIKNGLTPSNTLITPQTPLIPLEQTPLNEGQTPLKIGIAKPSQLFNSLTKIQGFYMDVFNPKVFHLTTSFVLATYCFELFPAIGYLFLNSDKETGKTKFAEIISNLSFNPIGITSPSEAVLFRILEQTKGTMLIDDYEKLPDERKAMIEQILKVGYKKGGKVPRSEKRGDDFVPVFFDVYSPKIITNTTTLGHILLSRCIPIHLMKTQTNKGRLWPNFHDSFWQYFRDCCYSFTMSYWKDIEKAYHEIELPELNNRDLELARPLLAVAKICGEKYFGELRGFLLDCFEQKSIIDVSTSWEYLMFKGMFMNVAVEEDWYSPKQISGWTMDELWNVMEESDLPSDKKGNKKKPSSYWVGKQLTKVPVFRKRKMGASNQYLMSRSLVEKVMQSHGFPLPELDKDTGEIIKPKRDVIDSNGMFK